MPWPSAAGLALLAVTAVLVAWPGGGLGAGFAALFALILGAALLVPGALVLAVPPLAGLLGAAVGPLGRMAARGITAALSRTALAVIALTVALSATVGVGVMIDSFRGTVDRWLQRTLAADLVPVAAGPGRGAPLRAAAERPRRDRAWHRRRRRGLHGLARGGGGAGRAHAAVRARPGAGEPRRLPPRGGRPRAGAGGVARGRGRVGHRALGAAL
ncbi:MAG: hypothetical protein U5K43_02940 [Halofilum sp. (in: g-proteobacteria)]|nr:hypothetical protein [Halofilum sp. (in: g-proteobacteria)]